VVEKDLLKKKRRKMVGGMREHDRDERKKAEERSKNRFPATISGEMSSPRNACRGCGLTVQVPCDGTLLGSVHYE
jgi:hypothetical protein